MALPAKEIEDRFQRSFFGNWFPRTLSGATVKCPIRGMIRVFRVDSIFFDEIAKAVQVRYEHEADASGEVQQKRTDERRPTELTPEDWTAVPAETVESLQQAVARGDIRTLRRTVADLATAAPEPLVEGYEYDELSRLLRTD